MNLDDLLYESSDEECPNYRIYQNIPRHKPGNSSKDTEVESTTVINESLASKEAVKFLEVELQLSEYHESFTNDPSHSDPRCSNSYDDLCLSLGISLSLEDGQMPSKLFIVQKDKAKTIPNNFDHVIQDPSSSLMQNKHVLQKPTGQCSRNKHARNHSDQLSFLCFVCGEAFSNKHSLKLHSVTDKCHRLSVLRKHKRTNTEKNHKCDVCKKCFARKRYLDEHFLTHTGEKPHICHICQKAFSQKCNLRRHRLTHTGEKSHICGFCQKAFALKSSLRKHHLTHTGERPYICDICQKGFNQKSNLNTHHRTHTGKTPPKCHV